MVRLKFLVDSNTLIYASKERQGEIARRIQLVQPYVTDKSYYKCLIDWKSISNEIYQEECAYLTQFFELAEQEGRFIKTDDETLIQARAQQLFHNYNIKLGDDVIAATAELFSLILVTADIADFARRLEKLNQQGLGNFKLQPYAYSTREETFRGWIEAYLKNGWTD
jgi:predicted nucleic acid-binding protein